ncbi:MAG: histidine kinase [Actinomycetota bacterium]
MAAATALSGSTPDLSVEGPSRFRGLAWPIAILCLLVCATTATFAFLNRSAIHSLDKADPTEVIVPIGFAIIGAMLASRLSRNPIGWIFLGIAFFAGVPGIATQYTLRSTRIHPLPATAWVAWTHDWMAWLVFPAGLALFFFLLFPDGKLQSPRWRRFAWVSVAILVVGFVCNVLEKVIQLQGSPPIKNPLGSIAVVDVQNGAAGLIWLFALIALLAAMGGTILRMRRATGDLKQQLRWLAYASVVIAVSLFAALFFPNSPSGVWDAIIVLGFGVAVPVSCGIAILKHGLYDLDVVISKTVVYALLAAFFTIVYVAVVVGIGSAIGSTHNTFLTLLAAALIAIAFNPVRERAKRLANRLVYGHRASPYEVLSEFSDRMAETYSLEDVLPRMAQILGEGTGAAEARVWLRIGEELRPAAAWGEENSAAVPVALTDGELPPLERTSRAVPVRDRGDLLGALAVRKPESDPLSPAESRLVDDLAAQAGLVLRNVRLTEELRANLEELQASRQRIVSAQDQERRRLERNIHDGAQQQLVALAVKLRLADGLVDRDAQRAHNVLTQLQQDTQDALENLRDLARGIYPPLLADQGLVAALDSQARKSLIPVSLESDDIGRYGADREAAIYFCALEALQNVGKYASASAVTIRLDERDGRLVFEVTDDGVGFDPKEIGYGTGLQGMADRLAALGGTLEVRSTPAGGTTVVGNVPVPREKAKQERVGSDGALSPSTA